MKDNIIIHKPIIEYDDSDSLVLVKVCIEEPGNIRYLWYKVPRQYEQYITMEVADAFIVAFLLYAMERGLNLRSELPVSSRLLVKLRKYLIPFINYINKDMMMIDIIATSYKSKFEGEHCGTGISCGVDSLSTVVQHGLEESEISYKIDTLTLLNTGYYGGENSSTQYLNFIGRSESFCNNFGFHFMTVDSNIADITGYNFLSAHTYLTCSTLLLFQKYFRVYYYASGYPVADFRPVFKDSAYYDIYLLNCISTESLDFISSCCTLSRVDKTRIIANYSDIFSSLYVCVSGNSSHNCSECEKCIRTMLALEAIRMKERIPDVFNVEIYNKNRIKYISYMLRHRKRSVYYQEIYNAMKENKVSIPILAYVNIVPCRFEIRRLKNKCKTLLSKFVVGRALINWVKKAHD